MLVLKGVERRNGGVGVATTQKDYPKGGSNSSGILPRVDVVAIVEHRRLAGLGRKPLWFTLRSPQTTDSSPH